MGRRHRTRPATRDRRGENPARRRSCSSACGQGHRVRSRHAAQLRDYGYCLACDFGIGAPLARCSTGANQIISVAMSDIDTEEKPPVPLKDRKAWHEGYRAGRRGLAAGANPYPLGTTEAVTGDPVSSSDGGSAWVWWPGADVTDRQGLAA